MAHTACTRGTPVLVTLTTGEQFRDHFAERRSRVVVFRGRGRVPKAQIRSFSLTHAKAQRVRGRETDGD